MSASASGAECPNANAAGSRKGRVSQAVTIVVVSGDDASKVELETALRPHYPEIPVVDLGGGRSAKPVRCRRSRNRISCGSSPLTPRPEPDRLDELLDAIGETESIAAVGPKLMCSGRIVSAGVSTTSAGERFNPVGPGEIDQGQRDSQIETLGLDLPGLLIATTELERIGAPSRVLGPAYSGLEYSRRLRDLGARVLLAPRARMEISAASAARLGSSPHPPRSNTQIRLSSATASASPVRGWSHCSAFWRSATSAASSAGCCRITTDLSGGTSVRSSVFPQMCRPPPR